MVHGACKPPYRTDWQSVHPKTSQYSRPWTIVHESKGTGETGSTIGTTRQHTKRGGHQRAAHLGYSYHCKTSFILVGSCSMHRVTILVLLSELPKHSFGHEDGDS